MSDIAKFKPVEILPFKLQDISDFIVEEFPRYHPDTAKYRHYWTEQAKRCIEGHWGWDYNDKTKTGGWRWIPGNLYFYVNMTEIEIDMDDNTKKKVKPLLRDVEWYIFYGLAACDGFSGFDEDDEYTCYLPIGKLERGEELTVEENRWLQKYDHLFRNKEGEYKKFVEPREYLYKTHTSPKGKAMYFNEARNLILLSSRRVGKSFSTNAGCILYDFTFNGARNLSDYLESKTNSTIIVGAEDSSYTKELLKKFESSYTYIKDKVGSYSDGVINVNGCFWAPTSGSLKKSGGVLSNSVPLKSGQGYTGAGSKIVNVSYHNNPNAGVGYGARRMVVEEAGLLESFKEVHAENSATQIGNRKYGYSVYIGTGGNVEKIQGIRDAFLNPETYDCLGYENVYANNGKQIGMFIPCYYKNNQFRDDNGNLDIELSFKSEMEKRLAKKKEGSKAYEGHIISFPMDPKEMFMQSSGNIFPTVELEERITQLESGLWEKIAQVGTLQYMDRENKVAKFVPIPKDKAKPIWRYGSERDMRENERSGAIIIYEHPLDNKPEPTFERPLYLVVYDPVRTDTSLTGSSGTSLASVLVFKFWYLADMDTVQYNIVAEWIGRHSKLNDDHEVAFKLATYYGAKILPEINNEDILRRARQTNRTNMIQYEPIYKASELVKARRSFRKGINVVRGMKPDMETYANEVLTTVTHKKERIEGNLETLDTVMMVEELPSIRLTEELLYYNRDDNFDHVSSFLLLGLFSRSQDIQPLAPEDPEDKQYRESSLKRFISDSEKSDLNNSAFNW